MSSISINVAGKVLRGWQSVQITKAMDQLCGSFSVAQSAILEQGTIQPMPVFPGDEIALHIDDSVFMRGFIDSVNPSISSRSHSIAVSGREVTCDLIDCGRIDGAGQWKKLTISQIITQIITPFGLRIERIDADIGDALDTFSAEPGDSVFTTIHKLCTLRGMLPMTTLSGNLALVQVGDKRSSDILKYGVNVLSASGQYNHKERFSQYVVRGQNGFPENGNISENKTVNIQASAQDSGIIRYRPALIIASNDIDQPTAQKRANWEAQTRAAKSGALSVTVQGWKQTTGELWECAALVQVEIPYLIGGESQEFLISSISYKYDSSGSTATLSLVSPDAYKPMPAKKVSAKQADPWANIRRDVRGST